MVLFVVFDEILLSSKTLADTRINAMVVEVFWIRVGDMNQRPLWNAIPSCIMSSDMSSVTIKRGMRGGGRFTFEAPAIVLSGCSR